MFSIYHIPTFVNKDGSIGKIGCTHQIPQERVLQQGYSNFETLETHKDIYIASNRERELQNQYGYKIDSVPYWMTIKNQIKSRNKKSRIKAIKSRGDIKDVLSTMGKKGGVKGGSIGGKISGKQNVENGHLKRICVLGGIQAVTSGRLAKYWELKKKPIIATNIKTGEKIEFNSSREAATHLNDTNICNVLKGRYKQSKGYYYEYKVD